jgi:hypothetical protein
LGLVKTIADRDLLVKFRLLGSIIVKKRLNVR